MFAKIILFIFVGHLTLAAADELCWTKEEDPATKQPYASQGQWEDNVFAWKAKQHSQFNPIALLKAFSTYSKEKNKANSMTNDKLAHCYIGCKIAQRTDYKTARFVAWYKEMMDISDCKMDTHFEQQDYEATLKGAEAGKSKSTQCDTVCPSLIETL